MNRFYRFIGDVVRSDYGMSIRDVMATDFSDLMAVISSRVTASEEVVMDLADFITQSQGNS